MCLFEYDWNVNDGRTYIAYMWTKESNKANWMELNEMNKYACNCYGIWHERLASNN